MISQQKTSLKKIRNLVNAAQRLAALQYLAGLYSGKPKETKIKPKVDKAWQEFQLAADSIMASNRVVIHQENNLSISLDMDPNQREHG